MTSHTTTRESEQAEKNRFRERGEQFKKFINLAIKDERIRELVPSESRLNIRGITVRGNPFQITAFRPGGDTDAPWRARITFGDLEWEAARTLETDDAFPTGEAAIDHLEGRLRDALAPPPLVPWPGTDD